MSESGTSFGRAAADCASSAALVDLESREGRADRFAAIDAALAGLVARCARGDHVVRVVRGDLQDRVEIVDVADDVRVVMVDAFRLESQQSRGAWFLPETVSVKVGLINFATLFREYPRYAHTLAAEERGKIALAGSPDAMVLWSALEPMFGALLQPLILRSEKSGLLSSEEFAEAWSSIEEFLEDIRLDLRDPLRVFARGGGWACLSAEQQIAAKAALLAAVADRISVEVVRCYRARATRALIAQYYAKAKKGRAKRRQVVTKEHWRTIAAFFAGDWLAFLEYLGEQPHEEERVVIALPETKIIVGGKERATAIAATKGIPIEEVERMLGAYWEAAGGESPVGQRAGVLSRYWREFDVIHARQSPGMRPLWGLVQEGGWGDLEPQESTPYQPNLFRQLLSPALVSDIERLWGTTVLAKWPDAIVTEPFPHSAMAEAFGPALKFWHGCALTAWFICEGPMSRTDIPGLAHYHRRELAELEEMGCGIHSQLFEDLKNVQLGPEQPIYGPEDSLDVGHGISLGLRVSAGSRRDGFVLLRDATTYHRRWWTENVFDRYLRSLWESSLKSTGRRFNLMIEEKGKPPTLKQFAKYAVPPAQAWFAGDISLVYATLGQKLTTTIDRRLVLPRETARFASQVFEALGGERFERKVMVSSPEEGRAQADAEDRHRKRRSLAGESLRYVQLLEALNRPPTLKEFGSKFEWPGQVLASDIDAAWSIYEQAVNTALAAEPGPRRV